MDNNPTWFSATGGGCDKVKGLDTRTFPVEQVSWQDVQTFLKKLSGRPEEKKKGLTYRLPSEAEWEYSCRGGLPSYQIFHFGNSLSSRQANFNGNFPYGGADKGTYLARTCQVGSYPPNAFGLWDMHGNVWEWCQDWYAADSYASSPRRAPPGPSRIHAGVFRGGSWSSRSSGCRSAFRYGSTPANRSLHLGFRVALVPSGS